MSPNDAKLKDLLADVLLIDDDQYRDDYGPREISSWDSLGMVSLSLAVEKEFGEAMSPEEMVGLQSIGDVKSFLRGRGVDFAE